MAERMNENNQAIVEGAIISEFEYSHEVFGEAFYFVKLKVSRLSQSQDIIPLLVSERLIDVHQSYLGQNVKAKGQFRSYNKRTHSGSHLILSLFVKELVLLEHQNNCELNSIFLDGYVCKEPVYRMTPTGREIADVLLAVNRSYSKSDYIPCICWGRNARFAENLSVGSRVQMWGRIQSRDYRKKKNDDIIRRVAYEISVNKMECRADQLARYDQVAESAGSYINN